jgi:mannonate dehydratase
MMSQYGTQQDEEVFEMYSSLTRRRMMQAAGVSATAALPAASAPAPVTWPVTGTPRICLGAPATLNEAGARRLKQIGVDYVLMGGPPMPWTEQDLKQRLDRFKSMGITICNMMIGGFNDVIWGRPGAARQIEDFIASIRAAGKAGLPVIEYNFYANRLMEGYKEEIGRAGAGYTAYDYELSKNLPPLPGVGAHTRADQLKRAEGLLKAVIPEAEKANVRLALHPNDPPVPISRGSEQLMATFDHWKQYINLVKSPYNGMTYDCGVSRELGEDPVAICRWLGERDCINHAHYRNVIVRKPYVDYTEVFIDNGQVNMFAVMKELVRQKYPRGLYPEHPRALDIDRERGIRNTYPGGGGEVGEIYNVAYTRAMIQAALSS